MIAHFADPYIIVDNSDSLSTIGNTLYMDNNNTTNTFNPPVINPSGVDYSGLVPVVDLSATHPVADSTATAADNIWIDLKLARSPDGYYLWDKRSSNCVNLSNKLESQQGRGVPDFSRVSKHHVSLKLDVDRNTSLETINFQGAWYKGLYLDLKFKDATLTSGSLPIKKNDQGHFFIIWKKVPGSK